MTDLTHLRSILQQVGSRMTAGDIVEEYGYNRKQISDACSDMGIELPHKKQITIQFIREMAPHVPVSAIAKRLGVNTSYVEQIACDHKIRLLAPEPEPEAPPPVNLSREEAARRALILEHKQDLMSGWQSGRKRIREQYIQSGSPFGIADEMKNIEVR